MALARSLTHVKSVCQLTINDVNVENHSRIQGVKIGKAHVYTWTLFVENPGEVSNFLAEDFGAVIKFMDVKMAKRKLKNNGLPLR